MGRHARLPSPDGQWRCSKCHTWKDPDKFYANRHTTNGLSYYCKSCSDKPNLERRQRLAKQRFIQELLAECPHSSAVQRQQVIELWVTAKEDPHNPTVAYDYQMAYDDLCRQELKFIAQTDPKRIDLYGTTYEYEPLGPPTTEQTSPKEFVPKTHEEIIAQWERERSQNT